MSVQFLEAPHRRLGVIIESCALVGALSKKKYVAGLTFRPMFGPAFDEGVVVVRNLFTDLVKYCYCHS